MGTAVEVSKSSSRALNLKISRASIVANGGLREEYGGSVGGGWI